MSDPIETDGLRIYLSQIEDYPILTREKENYWPFDTRKPATLRPRRHSLRRI